MYKNKLFFDKTNKKRYKNLGFYKDIDGIYTRYLNEKDSWKEHLLNTRESILKSAENKDKNLCVVLGSGWWLDIPGVELSEMFKKLILVDIVHPKQIRHLSKKYSNIELHEIDITGVGYNLYEKVKSRNDFDLLELIPERNDFSLSFYDDIDYLVSANLLSQLSVFFETYLNKKSEISSGEILKFSKAIQKQHVDSLPIGKSCFIVDYYEKFYNKRNEITHEGKRILVDLPEDKVNNEWVWKFDSKGNYKLNKKVYFNVKYLDV